MTKKQFQKDKYLQKTYGISLLQYHAMLLIQGYCCAICKKHNSLFVKSLSVDHNHKTGKTRGLLCFYCNHKLVGRHSIESATKILNYLTKYDEVAIERPVKDCKINARRGK